MCATNTTSQKNITYIESSAFRARVVHIRTTITHQRETTQIQFRCTHRLHNILCNRNESTATSEVKKRFIFRSCTYLLYFFAGSNVKKKTAHFEINHFQCDLLALFFSQFLVSLICSPLHSFYVHSIVFSLR